jgi:O-antigen/teichoic acid export membrane protein
MEQTRLGSLIEAGMNILIGFGVALASQMVVFPMVGIHGVSLATNLEIGAYFTAISLIRSYIIRRWFNRRLRAAAQFLASKSG